MYNGYIPAGQDLFQQGFPKSGIKLNWNIFCILTYRWLSVITTLKFFQFIVNSVGVY